jgi:cellulose biosynthesis protein BcsQ
MRLSVCSSKGGVGKTSTAVNLATVFGERGRTLAVDADPQDSLGRAFGVVAGPSDSLAAVLGDPDSDVREVIRRDVVPGVDCCRRIRPSRASVTRSHRTVRSPRACGAHSVRSSTSTTRSSSTPTATTAT